MKSIIISFFSSLLSLLVIDVVWLGIMAKRFYASHLGSLMSSSPKFLPAGIFYLLYALGLTIFVITPAIQGGHSLIKTFFLGTLFGLVAYATYDLSNQATLKDWPVIVTLVDLLWGALLTGTVSLIVVYLTKNFS
jgi:uncharacterized membrane protein